MSTFLFFFRLPEVHKMPQAGYLLPLPPQQLRTGCPNYQSTFKEAELFILQLKNFMKTTTAGRDTTSHYSRHLFTKKKTAWNNRIKLVHSLLIRVSEFPYKLFLMDCFGFYTYVGTVKNVRSLLHTIIWLIVVLIFTVLYSFLASYINKLMALIGVPFTVKTVYCSRKCEIIETPKRNLCYFVTPLLWYRNAVASR